MLQVEVKVILDIKSLQTAYISRHGVDFETICVQKMLSRWHKTCFGVIQVNMSLISGANTNVTFQIQVHVHLTGKCLLRYTEVVLHYMETDLHTLYNLLFLFSLCTGD